MTPLNIFYDIETLTVNRSAKPTQQHPIEYVVTVIYELQDDVVRLDFPNIKNFIEYLIKLPKIYSFNLIAHNGNRYDAHFLRQSLVKDFALVPKTAYSRNSVSHENEVKKRDAHGDYFLENRVKSKTSIDFKFRIGLNSFKTDDTLPKFQCSIETLGDLLAHHNLISKDEMKLDDYDYTRYDKNEDLDYFELRKYALNVFNHLTTHEYEYIHNDVYIMYMGWKHYNVLFPNFDLSKMTLSQNILNEYKVNDTSTFQLLNQFDDINLNYSEYMFDGGNMYDYVHHFYKGGLNFYNDNYIGKFVNNVKHIDKNSSYPFVMANKRFPTYLMSAETINRNLELDNNYYYMIKISKASFNLIIGAIKSKQIIKMLVKYFNNPTDYVYLSTPHIDLIGKFLKHKIKTIPAVSYLKWETRPFGANDTIRKYYDLKTENKIAGYDDKEIYVYKVLMNGIYGIPALRAFFNEFKIDSDGNLYNDINGFKNKERNLVFASSVTAYSFQTLLDPLTNNVDGVDDGFIYCDTDSLFMKEEYYATIEQGVFVDKYDLAAWKVEHEHIDTMFILNHKKYAITFDGKIDVRCGGVPLETFNLKMSFEKFVRTQFSEGAVLKVKKGVFTNHLTPVIYVADTEIKLGEQYANKYSEEHTFDYNMALIQIHNKELREVDEPGIYYETEFGAIAINEAFPYSFKESTFSLDYLIQQYILIRGLIE